jgi:hypothetical protein
MTGTLVQIITIAAFGNEFLKNGKLTEFYPENSSFQFCDFVDFREIKKKNFFTAKKEIITAKNPLNWFENLKNNGCIKLRLFHQTEKENDHQLAGFVGGGGNWFIETVYPNYSDFWVGNWNHDKNLTEKPWQVTYGKAVEKQPTRNQQFDLKNTRNELNSILEKLTDFAFKETNENWGNIFEKAKETLNSENPETDFYHTDLISTKEYELQNRQLLLSASKAFVFGGMGSWNDMGFENKKTNKVYHELSTELYDTMNKSIICAINNDKTEKASG